MAYYDLHFMDNILRGYFAALPTCILMWCTEFMVQARTLLVTDLPGSSQHAITMLPPPQTVHIKITIHRFYKLYRVFIL